MSKAETRKDDKQIQISRSAFLRYSAELLVAGGIIGSSINFSDNSETGELNYEIEEVTGNEIGNPHAGLIIAEIKAHESQLQFIDAAELFSSNLPTPGINPGLSTNEDGQFVISEGHIQELQRAGARAVNFELGIRGWGAEGWSDRLLDGYEVLMNQAAANGMEVGVQVGGGTIYGETSNQYEDWNRNSIESGGYGRNNFISELVTTTAKIVDNKGHKFSRLIVWNEPAHLNTYLEPSMMASLMTDMYIAVKLINPNMEIGYGGYMATEDYYFKESYLKRVIDYGKKYFGWGENLPWDVVDMHMYTSSVSDYSFSTLIGMLRSKIPASMPIRITEVGWESHGTTESENVQANNLQKFYQFLAKHPELLVKEANWFTYRDMVEGGVPKLYGLVRGDNEKKPAYKAFQEFAAGMDVPTVSA